MTVLPWLLAGILLIEGALLVSHPGGVRETIARAPDGWLRAVGWIEFALGLGLAWTAASWAV